MAEDHEGEILFIGVSNNDTVEDGRSYRDEFSVPYPLGHAPGVWKAFGVPYQPVTVVIAADGSEFARFDGPVTKDSLRPVLEQALRRS